MDDLPLFIGIGNNGIHADHVSYLSNFNFAERRTIIWDPDTLLEEIYNFTKVPVNTTINNKNIK